MKTILALVFFPIAMVLVGMIVFGEIIGYILAAIIVFIIIRKK